MLAQLEQKDAVSEEKAHIETDGKNNVEDNERGTEDKNIYTKEASGKGNVSWRESVKETLEENRCEVKEGLNEHTENDKIEGDSCVVKDDKEMRNKLERCNVDATDEGTLDSDPDSGSSSDSDSDSSSEDGETQTDKPGNKVRDLPHAKPHFFRHLAIGTYPNHLFI